MAQRVLKEKRKKEDERRRHEKLEELFDKCDPNEDCRVHINALREMHKELDLDFDEETVRDIISDREMMTKVEFVKFGVNTKLVENVEKAQNELDKKETEKMLEAKLQEGNMKRSKSGGFSFWRKEKDKEKQVEETSRDDRILCAFNKFDTDGDGFLSWEEFSVMIQHASPGKEMGMERAQRFFRMGDVSGDGRIDIDEFRRMADKGQAK